VWIAGNARTNSSFSATVQLLTATANLAGVCAYASNYPPVGQYISLTEISFTGTPMYEILLAKLGSPDQTAKVKSGDTFFLPCDYTLASFTDATGAPGLLNCIPPSVYILSGLDIYEGADVALTLSGSQDGWRYQLYRDATAVGNVADGTGGVLTFSDASASAGNFNYTVRTLDATGTQCAIQVSNVLAITVNVITPPPHAASAQLWTVGSSPLIWSDVINVPACNHEAFTNDYGIPYCRSFFTNGKTWYYYNWSYVYINKDTLCPSPWRVPTKDDFIALDVAFGGSGVNRIGETQSWVNDNYVTKWGGTYGVGIADGSSMTIVSTRSYSWSSTDYNSISANILTFDTSGSVNPQDYSSRYYGFLVRCVR
jgi:uncharacterized protein (TIGR02145 family)